jgi:hypothetical protein
MFQPIAGEADTGIVLPVRVGTLAIAGAIVFFALRRWRK